MGETGLHAELAIELLPALKLRFAGQQVLVGTNQFMDYVEGDPSKVVCPDIYVVFGVDPAPRRVWKTWVEGLAPQLIIELLSRSTSANDLGPKRKLYERLGVREYFTYDLLGELPPPRLRGWRLRGNNFAQIDLEPGFSQRLHSETLGLMLQAAGEMLRVYEADSGAPVPSLVEAALSARHNAALAQRDAEMAQREVEAARGELAAARVATHRAEAEAARLRVELDRLRRTE
jgi:Uma2 family endonuclease